MESNAWENNSDDEYNDTEYEVNETPPPEIDTQFKDNILKLKHNLYDNIVLSSKLETKNAQDKRVLNTYINKLNGVYIMAIELQNGRKLSGDLSGYPESTRQLIKDTFAWLANFFSKNRVEDTIPYMYYINHHMHEYPFIQRNSFDTE
jgi:hypothetical protein